MRNRPADARLLDTGELTRFTALAAVLAILADAAVGHGLLWENDPYSTYWITKTFLIATVFGLGTAWLGGTTVLEILLTLALLVNGSAIPAQKEAR